MKCHHILPIILFLCFIINAQAQGFFEGFENGPSSGDYTSDYTEITSGTIVGGTYAITGNARNVHPAGNGSPNSGDFFMAVNGAHTVGEIVWENTVTVTPHIDYEFSAQVKKIIGGANGLLSFRINGVQLGNNVSANSWTWNEYSEIWNSGSSTAATLSIVSLSNARGGNDFGLDDIALTVNSSLPIELYLFELSQEGKQVVLDWVTVSELNNDYFSVERSQNMLDWELIGQLEGAGTSNHEKSYRYIDESPYNGHSYYRIAQTDFDGKRSYSPIRATSLSTIRSNNSGVTIYPIPAKEQITIEGIKEDVHILNLIGEDISSQLEISFLGERAVKANISLLKPGIYLVKSRNTIHRFVKQ